MCCAQPRELEPADDVLESHLLERLSQGIVDGILVPRRDRAEVRLDLRPESLDRRVVRAVGRQGQEPGTRPPDGRRGGISLMGDRLSHTTTSPACSSGTSTCSTYDSNAAVSVDPGNASGARTPSSPNAAITVSDSHEPGAEPTARSPRRGPAVGPGHRRGHPRLVHENKPFRLDPLHLPPEGRRFSRTSDRSRSSACWVFFLEVKPHRRKARQIVVRLQSKPPCSRSWSRVSSLCSWMRCSRRRWSSGLRTGVGPPPCGLGANVSF